MLLAAALPFLSLLPSLAVAEPGPIGGAALPQNVHSSHKKSIFTPRRRLHKNLPRASLPDNWALQGCISDSTSSRALTGYSYTSTSMTPALCIATCTSKGFSKAGVEFGSQCYCGNSVVVSSSAGAIEPASDCSMQCAGDASQSCGSGDRLQLYTYAAPALLGWSFQGCYTDDTSDRALNGFSQVSSTNTPASCLSTCAAKGFSFGGVEFGQECYCGNSITTSSSTGVLAASGDCSMPCAGDSSETCGAGGRIQIYQASSSPPTTGSTTTTSSSVSTIISITTTTATPTPTSTPASTTITSALPSGTGAWTLKGCYTDDENSRALAGFSQVSSSNTPASCLAVCSAKGFPYGGVEYGQECYCGSSISTSTSSGVLVGSSDCSMACSGDPSLTCGSGNRIQIYEAGASSSSSLPTSSVPTSSVTKTSVTTSSLLPTTTASWVAQGCFSDDTSDRALQGSSVVSSSNTPATCQAQCLSEGFTFAGVEFGQECYCANSLTVSSSSGQSEPASDCSMACAGDPSQTCGNGGRVFVYAYRSSPITTSIITTSAASTSTVSTSTVSSSTVTTSSTPAPTSSSWVLQGCYSDDTSDRALQGTSSVSSTNTPSSCQANCLAQGYSLAGVEFGQECYCSNTITTSSSTGQLEPSTDCSMPCAGDPSLTCGSGGRLAIYAYETVVAPRKPASVGYFGNWGIYDRNYQPSDVPADKLTHILYSFADISPDTGVVSLTDLWADQQKLYPSDTWGEAGNNLYGCFKQFYLMKKANRQLKVLLSVGGFSYSQEGHFGFITNPTARAAFVSSAIQLLEDNGLDGIDIDFEYPSSSTEASAFASLLSELRTGLDAHALSKGDSIPYEISAAVAAGYSNYQILAIPDMEKSLTWWNIMAYDYSGSWSTVSDDQANLYGGKTLEAVDTDSTIKYYVSKGATASKINMGIPLYGRAFENTAGIRQSFSGVGPGTWEAGVYDYKLLPFAGAQVFEDPSTGSSYSYDPTKKELVSYDTPNIARQKAQYVKTNGLGGNLFWDLSSDRNDTGSLVTASTTTLGTLDQTLNHLSYPGSQFDNVRDCMGGC